MWSASDTHRKKINYTYKKYEGLEFKMEEKIVFVDEDDNEIEMFVVEETRINNVNYILVTDDDESDEATAYILKDISDDEDEEAIYEMVDEDSELQYIGKIFSELLEDVDITNED
ncbi:MAG: DUF1292 domain-containing protein [Eubacterium sp.]